MLKRELIVEGAESLRKYKQPNRAKGNAVSQSPVSNAASRYYVRPFDVAKYYRTRLHSHMHVKIKGHS